MILYTTYTDGPYSDFILTAEVERLAGKNIVPYGISFRGQKDSYHSAYLFGILGAQQYSLERTQGGNRVSIKDWSLHSAITGARDKLKVECNGNKISLSVNDQALGDFTDGTHTEGSVGLYVAESLKVAFDNITVTEWTSIRSEPGPQTILYPRPRLLTAVPNPFRQHTVVRWHGPVKSATAESKLLVLTSQGEVITERNAPAGEALGWDGTDRQGQAVPPGVYFGVVHHQTIKLIKY
jgi:hypothetical protein